jgi:hypothetical protein
MSKNEKIAFVIAHHHMEGKLLNHFFDHVRYLQFLSNNITVISTNLNKNGINQLKPYAKVIVRKNRGYDFYSYKKGLNFVKHINNIDHLIFFNSSFIAMDPKKLYQKYLSQIYKDGFYGLTACSVPQYHIQSYFFSFAGRSIIQSKAFWDWWIRLKPIDNREKVIKEYEVGMTQWFLNNKFFVKSVYKPNIFSLFILYFRYFCFINFKVSVSLKKLKKYLHKNKSSIINISNSLNLTHFLFDDIFKAFGIIKIDLLTKNPTKQNLEYFIRCLKKYKNKVDGIKF